MTQLRLFPNYLGALLLRVFIAILIGVLLLSAVRLLPEDPMYKNLEQSAQTFEQEGIYPILFPWCTSQLDSTTDNLILMISACDTGENLLTQAMSGSHSIIFSEHDYSYDLAAHYGHGIPFDGTEPYYQYWHGYQVLIRPLLSIMSYPTLRVVNGIVQTGLLILICVLLHKRGLKQYILPYLAAVAMLMPLVLAMSLQYSSCYYILTLGSITVLLNRDQPGRNAGFLFLYLGMATSYFDFLTYPIATLGIPAVFYFCIHAGTLRDTFCRGVKLCFSWAVGYVGMWAGKWIVGSLILKQNILALAGETMAERSSADAIGAGLLHTIRAALAANIRSFLRTPATLVTVLLAMVLLVMLIRRIRKHRNIRDTAVILFPFVILAILPIDWYLVTSQHALIHYWFTNKGLCVSAFAGLAGLTAAGQAPHSN